jgi:hypothetical protein
VPEHSGIPIAALDLETLGTTGTCITPNRVPHRWILDK